MNFIYARHPSLVKRFVQMLFSKMDISVMRKWHSDNAVIYMYVLFLDFSKENVGKKPTKLYELLIFLLLKRGENSLVLLFFFIHIRVYLFINFVLFDRVKKLI